MRHTRKHQILLRFFIDISSVITSEIKMKLLCVALLSVLSIASANVQFVSNDVAPGEITNRVGPMVLDFHALDKKNDGLVSDHVEVQTEVAERSPVIDTINNALENLRELIIDTMDPLEISYAGPFSYTYSTGTRATVHVRNFRAEGLRWFLVDDLTISALRLTIGGHVTLPWLLATGSYDVDARLAILITHYASGNFRVFLNRLECGINVRMGTNLLGGHLVLRELDLKLALADLQIQLTGMTGSDLINSYINRYIRNLTQELIQNQMDQVSEIISTEVFDTINEILSKFTVSDIFG